MLLNVWVLAAVDRSLGVLRHGGRMICHVHYTMCPLVCQLAQNISVAGGAASVTTYDKQVLLKQF